MTKEKTLFAVKLKGTKRAKEYVQGILILVIILGGTAAIGGLQYMICKSKKPNAAFLECIQSNRLRRPLR